MDLSAPPSSLPSAGGHVSRRSGLWLAAATAAMLSRCARQAFFRFVSYHACPLKQAGRSEEIWQTMNPEVVGLQGSSWKSFDVGVFTVYFPPTGRSAQMVAKLAKQLLDWLHEVLSSLPRRCSPPILTDLNSDIGSDWYDARVDTTVVGPFTPMRPTLAGWEFTEMLESSEPGPANSYHTQPEQDLLRCRGPLQVRLRVLLLPRPPS